MWGLELGREKKRREYNREIRLRVLVRMGDYMKQKKKLKVEIPGMFLGAEYSLL